jgi:hypothetical protein
MIDAAEWMSEAGSKATRKARAGMGSRGSAKHKSRHPRNDRDHIRRK